MKLFALVLLGASTQVYGSVVNLSDHEWLSFKATHNKVYGDFNEESERMKIYLENKRSVEEHNRLYEKGLASFSLKMNQFGDLRDHEFRARFNRLNSSSLGGFLKGDSFHSLSANSSDLPDAIDWRMKLAVTKVKNQGQCGSCWSFSATGAIEGQWKIKTGELVSLSEQNLIDCSTNDGNSGCNGGLMDGAFEYVTQNGGIDSEASYPYKGVQGKCRFNSTNVQAKITGYKQVNATEDALKDAVGTIGPISVAMDASNVLFQFYFKGVYDPWSCSSTDLDHGVLVVGYGHEDGKDYWLVKNSWGVSWGDAGYFKIIRNHGNTCGLASMASYPIVKES